nr:superoxide dismutase [Mn], mitochondrial-like [Tanacetum cinerariifolium]
MVCSFTPTIGGGEPPHSSLGWAIDQHFSSMEKLIAKISAEGAAAQGCGWVLVHIDDNVLMFSCSSVNDAGQENGLLGPNSGSSGKFECGLGKFGGGGGSVRGCCGNSRRGGSMAERGGGSLAKRLIDSRDSLDGKVKESSRKGQNRIKTGQNEKRGEAGKSLKQLQ